MLRAEDKFTPLGTIAGGIFQLAGGADPEIPKRHLDREARQFGEALRVQLPYQQYYAPQLQALNEAEQRRALFGQAAGTFDETTGGLHWIQPTKEHFDFNTGQLIPGRPGRWVSQERTLPVYRPGSEGLLALASRAAPAVLGAREAADPEGFALLRLLTQGASRLNAPDYTSPYEDRELVQSLRAAQSARGQGYGTGNAIMELLGLDRAREARTMQRGQYAGGVLGLRRGYQGDPYNTALGLLSGVQLGGAQQFANPWNAYNQGLQDYNANARAYEEIAQRQNRVQGITSVGRGITGLATGGATSILSGLGIGGSPGGYNYTGLGAQAGGGVGRTADWYSGGGFY